MPKGKRVQIYLPADLIVRFEQVPRYERSAEVAKALRQKWGIEPPNVAPNVAGNFQNDDLPQQEAQRKP